ncbi:hypothetical protein ACFSXZ_00160 [Amycolatopsis pigmentata]|uniref:Secreted protein n=2 Tax=Amycolatopsis pigmentata TaxID=450801 RepID=A0ABW5FIF0_9PSEU
MQDAILGGLMGLIARSIVTAALAAGLCLSTAVSANASPAATLECGTILGFGGPFGTQPVGAVCVSIGNGQVSGYDGVFPGGTTDLSTWITQCNAAQTVCSIVPGTEVFSPITPTVPTTPGEFYEACTSFIVTNAGNQIIAGGCSPLVAA